MEISFNDSKLRKALGAMDSKLLKKHMRGAFRKNMRLVKDRALGNLRSRFNSNRELEKGVSSGLYRQDAGFYVSIGRRVMKRRYKGKRGGQRRYSKERPTWEGFDMHTTRQGKELPVLIWLEGGTKQRHTRTSTKSWHKIRSRKAHRTGRVKAGKFMEHTEREMKVPVITSLDKAAQEYMRQIHARYGN